jgi:hypothetical protein
MSCICTDRPNSKPQRRLALPGLALIAVLMQLTAPALLLPHLREFHPVARPVAIHDGKDDACHHAGHSSPTEPSQHHHHECVVCQLAMHLQSAGLTGMVTALPQVAVLPVDRPALSLPAPDCSPALRLPDICGPPTV